MANTELNEIEGRLEDVAYRRAFAAANTKLDLALTLIEARTQFGVTQEQLALLSGVSQPYIAKLESGEANPTVGKVGELLAILWMKLRVGPTPLVPAERVASQAKAQPSAYEDETLKTTMVPQAPSRSSDFGYILNFSKPFGTSGETYDVNQRA